MPELLADSFAFIALFEGNERYRRIFSSKEIYTTALNVMEVYMTLLRRLDRKEAKKFSKAVFKHVIDVPSENAFGAAEFRRYMAGERKDCSTVDAWSYSAAKAYGLKFLTGDPAFKNVENVEFVR